MQEHIHIFFTDRHFGWCLQIRDAKGNETGTAYHYRKSDAVAEAKERGLAVSIFGRNGLFQKQLNPVP